ncbi:hypothetical protein BRE01_06930 [Brevibacillus reuszeri]|uniref:Transcriptional regulator n=1 Tax=Brevibacillus reuszeri TaxID=54915 RepID=A0A0K9YRI8_9BACL|nr:WYL domain-containing protein [Brevibacillus reuszeri]KNB70805.1 transcriptional regulator [Brevibacillus reuszeri]MED1857186.1 WYL domain-containing protein [Brevibacillus reuszeri]GED66991.1 hypothetical protein BRE01_06930 [Brevibacillus reuszeri]
MARESFDKEIQFLRLLVLTSGAYTRQQFAERLGISVHTFDKTIKRLKEIIYTMSNELPAHQEKELTQMLRYSYYDSSDPMLLFLFRAKSLKESESIRLSLILKAIQEQALTTAEIIDICHEQLPGDLPLPDEKTIRSDLKYLEEVGVIRKETGGRPFRYRIHHEIVTGLHDEELTDLYDFVDVMANTQVPSVQGYLLRDNLKKARKQTEAASELFLYKYHFYSRILDEAHLYTLFRAIRQRRRISFLYFSPKSGKRYTSQNTNPLFEKESTGKQELLLPLKVIYDHQYGRWYLLGHSKRLGITKYRVEGLTQIEEKESVLEEEFARKCAALEEKIRFSWLIDTGQPVKIKVRFYHPEGNEPNFIKHRVQQQGQWGMITEENEDSFLFEIMVNGTMEIRPWLRSFGSSCEVLEPAYLRREFINEWKEIQSYYESIRENI